MCFIHDNMTEEALDAAIKSEASLYAQFDEAKFLAGGYSKQVKLQMTVAWIAVGDEGGRITLGG